MDFGTELAVVLGIIVVFLVAAFLWEIGRRTWYWSAAKIFGWSEHEKFNRETAWVDRAVARDQRQAQRDAKAAANSERRRMGVFITSAAVAGLGWLLNLPSWEVILIALGVCVGLTMAVGLAFKW